jgi:hypothetical protein
VSFFFTLRQLGMHGTNMQIRSRKEVMPDEEAETNVPRPAYPGWIPPHFQGVDNGKGPSNLRKAMRGSGFSVAG